MARYGRGAHNRKNDTVEKHRRLDSFHFKHLFSLIGDKEYQKCGKFNLHRNYIETDEGAILIVKVPHEISERIYFECPYCYRRARYLYWHREVDWFACRLCAKLNYNSQQKTKSNGDLSYYKIVKILDKLKATECNDWIDCASVVPPKPKYMHEKTYIRLLKKLGREQDIYNSYLVPLLMKLSNLIG